MKNAPLRCLPIFLLVFKICTAAGQNPPAFRSPFDSAGLKQSTEVWFASGRYELSPEAEASIDSVSNFYNQTAAPRKIAITAHTDSVGRPEMNKKLSENRAAAVRQALLRRGVPEADIQTTAFGESRPVAANASEQGRQRNRRATLDVLTTRPMATYAGQIKDSETGKGIEATLIFTAKNEGSDSIRTDTAGRYAVRLPQETPVKMEVYARDYFFKNQVIRLYGTPEAQRRAKSASPEITLRPARPGEKAVLNNLFFVGNEAILLKTSEPELPKVLKFMQINPHLKIEIGGHINQPMVAPNKLSNFETRLAERRAELVYNYLIQNGISTERLSWKGYGNSQMLFPNPKTEDEHEQNRRVEIKVLK